MPRALCLLDEFVHAHVELAPLWSEQLIQVLTPKATPATRNELMSQQASFVHPAMDGALAHAYVLRRIFDREPRDRLIRAHGRHYSDP